ncbi:FHA domain-containing protein [Actinoplanes sp. NPDC051633]|uniref:FHA domain-containing protein n=1 Tax=Actinoplanes sp. NPDC051633 TaxID=3155670 RepID=UPI003415AEA3
MTCPRGHESATDDFCDVCGVRMSTTVAIPQPTSTPPCPHCGTPPLGPGRFCENCGYDSNTGRVPVLSPPPVAAPAGEWTVTIVADKEWYDANAVEGLVFPASAVAVEVPLTPPQVRIGRKSSSKGTDPELDLADDPGVSHSHALLTQDLGGVWLVADMGSTNGTYVNDDPQPLDPGRSRPLADGDRLHVGAWTMIVLHAP